MYGFNLLGVNSHDSNFHRSSKDIDSILKGASEKFDSFKEVEDAIKELQALGDSSEALKEYLNSSAAAQLISLAVDSVVSEKGYVTEDSLKDYVKTTDLSDYAKKSELPKEYDDSTVVAAIETKADKNHTHDEYLTSKDLPEAYNDSELRTLISGKADLNHTHSNYVTLDLIPSTLPASDVPAWAKAAEKPIYTADEVGAMPANTAIPTKISDLEGSSELVKSGDISDWAKADSLSTVTLEATTETGEVITFTLIGSKNV